MNKQLIVIHGGDTFDTYEGYLNFLKSWVIDFEEIRKGQKGWKSGLGEKLGPAYEVIQPQMPNSLNAKYSEWKIWFEKFIPYFNDEVILLGHSMGGIFLAKYLSENILPKKIKATLLVAAPFDEADSPDSLGDFKLPSDISQFAKQSPKIFLYHSSDDEIVSFKDLQKYKKVLPNAIVREFKDRGHFIGSEFPEIMEDIKNI